MLIDNQIGYNDGRNVEALVTAMTQAFGLAA